MSQAGRVYGAVTNSETGDVVSYADASLNCGEDEDWDRTGALGPYRLFAYYPDECDDGTLVFSADGYQTQYHSTNEMDLQPGGSVTLNIALDEGTDPEPSVINGTVFSNGTGDPLPGAEVSAYRYDTGDTYGTQVNENGYFLLDLVGDQNYRVMASAEGHNDTLQDYYLANGDTLYLELYLDEEFQTAIHGTVTNTDGDSLEGVNVFLDTDSEWNTATTDNEGYYHAVLPPDMYNVSTSYYGYYITWVNDVELTGDSDVEVNIVLEPVAEFDGGVDGMVHTSGEESVSIAISVWNDTYSVDTYANEDNSFSIELLNGTYTIWVYAPGYEDVFVPDAFTVEDNIVTVSYTHLTLPTIYSV